MVVLTTDYVVCSYTAGASGGPFFARFRARCNIPTFSGVGLRCCRPTFLGKVRRRGRGVGAVVRGPRTPAFRGAVMTLSGDSPVLSHIDTVFFGVASTRAASRLARLSVGVTPMLSRRDSGVSLGRRLFTGMGGMCRRGGSLRLAARRRHLLSGACGDFMHSKTGLSTRGRTHLHRIGGRLSALNVAFDGGVLGRGGAFRLFMSGRRSLTNLPR